MSPNSVVRRIDDASKSPVWVFRFTIMFITLGLVVVLTCFALVYEYSKSADQLRNATCDYWLAAGDPKYRDELKTQFGKDTNESAARAAAYLNCQEHVNARS